MLRKLAKVKLSSSCEWEFDIRKYYQELQEGDIGKGVFALNCPKSTFGRATNLQQFCAPLV